MAMTYDPKNPANLAGISDLPETHVRDLRQEDVCDSTSARQDGSADPATEVVTNAEGQRSGAIQTIERQRNRAGVIGTLGALAIMSLFVASLFNVSVPLSAVSPIATVLTAIVSYAAVRVIFAELRLLGLERK